MPEEYCSKCQEKTITVFNDFMVPFCWQCKTVRRSASYHTGRKQPFKCNDCGRMMDEDYVGQTVCSDCEGGGLQSV